MSSTKKISLYTTASKHSDFAVCFHVSYGMDNFEKLTQTPEHLRDFYEVDAPNLIENMILTFTVQYDTDDATVGNVELSATDTTKEHGPKIVVKEDVKEWIETNSTGEVYVIPFGKFLFEKKQDRTWFCMKWVKGKE